MNLLPDNELVPFEIVPVRGKYYQVKKVHKNGKVILQYHPNHKFIDWENKRKDFHAENSVKRANSIPDKKIEIEELFRDYQRHLMLKVDEILNN